MRQASFWTYATCKHVHRMRGYAFLTEGEGSPDIFVRFSKFRGFPFGELRNGDVVKVRYMRDREGQLVIAELRPTYSKHLPSFP